MTEIDRDALLAAVRESGIALKPGDVLAVRLPVSASSYEVDNARAYARTVEAETGVKVAFIPGEEFAHTPVTVNVHVSGSIDDAQIIGAIQREIERYKRRDDGRGLGL